MSRRRASSGCTVEQALEFERVLTNSSASVGLFVLFPAVSLAFERDDDELHRELGLALRALSDRLLEVAGS